MTTKKTGGENVKTETVGAKDTRINFTTKFTKNTK